MLHIINKSPFNSDAYMSCMRFAQTNDVILLIEDGVIAALQHAKMDQPVVYALEADLRARGLLDRVLPNIQLINYNGFVDLTVRHYPIQNWS